MPVFALGDEAAEEQVEAGPEVKVEFVEGVQSPGNQAQLRQSGGTRMSVMDFSSSLRSMPLKPVASICT
jgi:hypothetical protein